MKTKPQDVCIHYYSAKIQKLQEKKIANKLVGLERFVDATSGYEKAGCNTCSGVKVICDTYVTRRMIDKSDFLYQ